MPVWTLVLWFALTSTFCLSSPLHAGQYSDSAHGDSVTGVDRSSIDIKYADYSRGNCSHCHEHHSSLGGSEPAPNGSPLNPSLRFAAEEELCNTCHDGSPVAKNVAAEFIKQYRHPVADFADRHTQSMKERGQNGFPFRGLNRHAECSDCHEPHTAQKTIHTAPGNAVSGVLLGAWGVEPSSELLWQPPLGTTEVAPASMEYQICFKCHSYYALQENDGITTFTGPSGVLVTDQSMEFSKANRSVHPVRVALHNQNGSYAPKALDSSRMKPPWNMNPGNQTMYCSDCHGNNASTPAGPHASNNLFLLEGNWSWPFRPGDGKLWTLSDISDNENSWNTRLLCAKCHTLTFDNVSKAHPHEKIGHTGSYNTEPYSSYDDSFACVACHIPIPHGSSVSRLIGYDSLPEPYKITVATGATFPVINQFVKETYSKRSCYVPNTAACHSAHTMPISGD